MEQRMGQLPIERVAFGSPPFSAVCLDLLGPVLVKGMVNKRAQMKVWPIIFVCQATGAVHVNVMHNYGTDAFLLQFQSFVSIRGTPAKVVSDKGSQLTSSTNVVAFTQKEDPANWGWDKVKSKMVGSGTEWEFVGAGCQYRNGLAERRVMVLKRMLEHLLANTMLDAGGQKKPTLGYAELQVLLQQAANITNDRPVGLHQLMEDELVPLTVNQLLLGRNSSQPSTYDDEGAL